MALAIDPRTLDYAALGIFVTVSIFLIYLVIYIHDIPYEIAKKRQHPHRDAIHIAGWVSLFLLHTIWPFLWIWAYLYKPGQGWGAETLQIEPSEELKGQLRMIDTLSKKVEILEKKLATAESELDDYDQKVHHIIDENREGGVN
jgi:cell division protein FtsL